MRRHFSRSVAAILLVGTVVVTLAAAPGRAGAQVRPGWRAASAAELEAFLPARANVEKERIETEMRTATGLIDARGRRLAAVVLITAGYSADGKYSHYLLTEASIELGDGVRLAPGAYVLGWTRVKDGLDLHVFDAHDGAERGHLLARPQSQPGHVEGFRIWPPDVHRYIQIGRFTVPYQLN